MVQKKEKKDPFGESASIQFLTLTHTPTFCIILFLVCIIQVSSSYPHLISMYCECVYRRKRTLCIHKGMSMKVAPEYFLYRALLYRIKFT